ncbi:hypothetical protein YTPLAS72_00910 [Nitrospira sp.]|nr:hypothetical protein YTPLAS72_00910 [Nitrospira sp.]
MKALVYKGPRDIQVKDVLDAKIERPTDVLVKITSTNICGSDLHMYEGRTDVKPGTVLGHENLGLVVDIGTAVDRVKIGDRVCLPFNIGLRLLHELRTRTLRLLPYGESRNGRRSLRVFRHGTLSRRTGGISSGTVRRFQLFDLA